MFKQHFFNIARIEAAVKAGKFKTIGTSKVPVVDGTHDANKDPKSALVAYVTVPKNPHGCNVTPDGKFFMWQPTQTSWTDMWAEGM